MERVVFPSDDQALAILDRLLRDDALTAEQRECLGRQRSEIGVHRCLMARLANWFRASFHVCAGSKPYPGLAPLPRIIQDEIDNSARWDAFCDDYWGKLQTGRQNAMLAHKHDRVKKVDLREFPYAEYAGVEGWESAAYLPVPEKLRKARSVHG
jgi:hypothetical protein